MDTRSGNCSEKCENNGKVGHRMTSSNTNSENCPGCGLSDLDKITITVAPTTGGRFDISVQKNIAVENLKKVISKKLKVPKERILLLHKERQLRDGSLQQNSIYHGSTLTLLPSVETGLLSQRPEQGVMQALESLNDSQVNDFLSGKAPLNLTMRLGDHMMLIQLQLSSVTPSMTRKSSSSVSVQQSQKENESYYTKHNVPSSTERASLNNSSNTSANNSDRNNVYNNNNNCSSSSSSSSSTSSGNSSSGSSSSGSCNCSSKSSSKNNSNSSKNDGNNSDNGNHNSSVRNNCCNSSSANKGNTSSDTELSFPNLTLIKSKLNTLLHKNNENLNVLKRKFNIEDDDDDDDEEEAVDEISVKKIKSDNENKSRYFKDLNLKNVLLNVPEGSSGGTRSSKYSDMMRESTTAEALTSSSSLKSQLNEDLQAKKSEILSQIMESVRKISENTSEENQTIEGKACDREISIYGSKCNVNCTCSNKIGCVLDRGVKSSDATATATAATALDTKTLAEASRNLTQTLKQLSSEVFTCRSENTDDFSSTPATSRRRGGTQGAIIESMQHHGKGVFSGTFSGTLNPALQDRFGRPKRDISTIIHILNDLLCATPQYRRQRQPPPQIKVQSHESSPISETSPATTELVSVENEATRGKVERLRMVMEQNRARRRARREAKTLDNATNDINNEDELESNNQDGTDLMEISPPEPVVA